MIVLYVLYLFDPVVDMDLAGGVKKFFGAGDINPNLVDPFVVVNFGGKEVRNSEIPLFRPIKSIKN